MLEERLASLAAGMNEHLTKPVDPKRLTSTLERLLPNVG
jgi:CheY-like chemotaxis protein